MVHKKKVHSGYRYACDWYGCHKVYKSKSLLNDHKNIHSGQKIYRCDWPGCDKTFFLQCSFSGHMSAHKNKNYF